MFRPFQFPLCQSEGSGGGRSQRKSSVAAAAPSSCARTNAATSAGRIPAKVLLAARAMVTAGFANEVEAVNQYAEVIYAATAYGTAVICCRTQPQITMSKPKVATNSLHHCAPLVRTLREAKKSGSPNMRCAAATPAKAPNTWTTI